MVIAGGTTLHLYSPNYPGEYPHSFNCEVNIRATDSPSRLIVRISNMDIEPKGDDCGYDYLYVSNIETEKLCLRQPDLVIERVSTQSQLALQFKTDGSATGMGYTLTVRLFDPTG